MADINYLMVQNNVVTNLVLWDGNVNTWTPPANATMLVELETPAYVWASDKQNPPSWILIEEIGAGDIGYTWDGTALTTNQPKPTEPPLIGTEGLTSL